MPDTRPILALFLGGPLQGLVAWVREPKPLVRVAQRRESSCASRKELADQIRITLFHELGNCLDFDEDGLKRTGLE